MLKIKLSKGECHYNTVSHRDKYVVEVEIPHQEEGVFIGRYKIYVTPMQKQTDKNIDNIKRLDINKECSHCVADNNFTGHLDLTAYAGNILRVVFCEGQLYSAYCECILAVQPLPISIKKMWLIDDAGKKFPGNKMQGMATEPISFLPEFNRPFLQGEYLDELNCQVYRKSISSDLFEPMKMLTSNKWDRPNLVFKITVAEDHAGAVMALSFFLNRPVNPNEQSIAPTLCYVSLVSGETMTPYIKSAVWSSKEMVKFGQASLEREEIYRNEDGFLHIETRGMYGQKVRVDLFEKDFMPPNEYLPLGSKENIPIANNVAYVPIEMSEVHSKAKRLRDFEGWEYEIIARITPDDKSIKPFDSKIINLIIDAKKSDEEAKRSTIDGSMKCVIGSAEDEKKEDVKKCFCGKEHIDLSKAEYWETQEPGQCWRHAVNMLNKYGVEGGANENPIIIASQDGDHLVAKDTDAGIIYLYDQLKKGHPIVVGVDDGRQEKYNSDKTTEHFILIVAYGCKNGKIYFRYFDPGSEDMANGTKQTNLLFVSEKFITGKSPNGGKNYTIAQIRLNK